MENKFIKYLFILLLLISFNKSYSQGNPGFLGKKIALGYSTQFCVLKIEDAIYGEANKGRLLTNHNFFVEYAKSRYQSFSLDIAYQKVPRESSGYNSRELYETYSLNGKSYTVAWDKEGGISDFSVLGIGLRYNVYSRNKTISAPIGFCSYLRADLFSIKALNNNYNYDIINKDKLTPAQINNAKIPEPESTLSQTVSFGFGMESKIVLSRTVFLRFNGELNFSSSLLYELEGGYLEDASINEELKENSKGLNAIRNLFILGMGVGVLL